jgi:S1-C subfamily serine protease
VCSSTLEKVVINTSESQQVHKHPPEAAAISRANVAAHSDVSDTQADQPGAEGYQDTNRISTPVPESRLERGQLGIRISELMVPGPPSDTFVVISDVTPGGPAAKAGVQKGDIILVANQKGIKRVQDFSLIVGSSPPKAPVRLDTVRFGKGEPRRYFDVPIWPFVA